MLNSVMIYFIFDSFIIQIKTANQPMNNDRNELSKIIVEDVSLVFLIFY
jgi:hypothetical protein